MFSVIFLSSCRLLQNNTIYDISNALKHFQKSPKKLDWQIIALYYHREVFIIFILEFIKSLYAYLPIVWYITILLNGRFFIKELIK